MKNQLIINKYLNLNGKVKVFCYSFLILLIIGCSSAQESPTNSAANTSLNDKLNQILENQRDDKPGLSILIRKDGQEIFKQSKGLANKNNHIRIDSNTGFRIGSISKPFTALAIMQLVEQGKLSLDMAVSDYVTELPDKWKAITIRHLLSHRVYISDDIFSDENLKIANNSTNQDVVEFLSSKRVKNRVLPTDQAIYCNSCYVLLAEVVARASGEGFADYLNKHIFHPANMTNSYIVEGGGQIRALDALNYAKTSSFMGIEQYTTGAMAQVSSIQDLNNFIVALKRGELVSHETLHLMTKVHADMGDDGLYGLGWIIGWGEEPFFSHGGSQDGYQSDLLFYPKYDLDIAILTNGGEQTYEVLHQLMKTTILHFKSLANRHAKT